MEHITEMFIKAFITKDRWKLYISGLGVTLEIALFAAVIGLIIGTLVALMKLSNKRNGSPSVLSYIATIYVDVIRDHVVHSNGEHKQRCTCGQPFLRYQFRCICF